MGSLKQRNWSLLLKWHWRFAHEETSLWRRVIGAIYGVETHRWTTKPLKGSTRGLIFIASKGDRVRFWEDVWMDTTPLWEDVRERIKNSTLLLQE